MEYLIIGVDPGTTTGVAALDFRGQVVRLVSSKDVGVNRLLDLIISLGTPSVIATDVNPAPRLVSKLSSKLGCAIHVPDRSLPISEKNRLTRDYDAGNSHQRDALAAAITAFNSYRNKFQKIDSMQLGEDVKHRAVQGIRITPPEKHEEKPKPAIAKPKHVPPPADKKRIKDLEKQRIALRDEMKEKELTIRNIQEELLRAKAKFRGDLARDSGIRRRDHVIGVLKRKVKAMEEGAVSAEPFKNLWHDLIDGKIVPVAEFPQIFDGTTILRKRLKKSDLEKLEKVRFAFTDDNRNRIMLSETGVKILDSEPLKELEGCFFIEKTALEKSKLKKSVSIEKLIEEYRTERSA